MKNKKGLISSMILVMSLLSACGSGGGGGSSSPSSTTPGGGSGIGSGGSGSGNNGNAAYYGVSTDSPTIISNQSTAPTGGTLLQIANQVAINVRDLNNRYMDLLIYQPTCVQGLLTYSYSVVLVNGATTSPMIGVVQVSANGIVFQERSDSNTNVGLYDYTSAESVSGTCANGEMILSGSGGTLFANGSLLVWRTSLGDVYVGAVSTSIATASTDMQLRQYKQYYQIFNGDLNPSSQLSTWSLGTTGYVSTDTDASAANSSFSTSYQVLGGGGSWNAMTNVYSSYPTQHIKYQGSSGSYAPYFGFATGNVGGSGKAMAIIVSRYATPSTVTANNGASTFNVLGSGALKIYIQNN